MAHSTRLTTETAAAAVGKSVQYRATGDFATLVRIARGACLIKYDRGGQAWVDATSLDRRDDRDSFDTIDEHARYMADIARYDAEERNDR